MKAADTSSPLYQGRQTGTSFSLAGLVEFGGGSYFWRIDEVEADGTTIHKGIVWGFTVPGYLIVDEFEAYTDDEGNRIYDTWIDGWTNGTGSTVGHIEAPVRRADDRPRRQAVHAHGLQQRQAPYYSEAEREFAPCRTGPASASTTLSLSFRGNPVAYAETGPGAFTDRAGGNDIWNNADQCRFAFKQLNGNGSIVARVDSLVMTSGWAKAGVMIRETLEAGSKHAAVVLTPSNGVSFPYRPFTGDISYQVNIAGLTAPYWVRLTRTGDVFKAEHSANGTTWTAIGAEQSISMMGEAFIGLCLTSQNVTATTTAQFSNVTASGGATAPGRWPTSASTIRATIRVRST